jgi:hypothetical protein
VLLDHVIRHVALDRGLRPYARFVPTDVNRVMLVTLRFAGFAPVDEPGEPGAHGAPDGRILLARDPALPPPPPPGHVRLITEEPEPAALPQPAAEGASS